MHALHNNVCLNRQVITKVFDLFIIFGFLIWLHEMIMEKSFFYFFMSRYAHLLLQSVGKGLNFGTDKVN